MCVLDDVCLAEQQIFIISATDLIFHKTIINIKTEMIVAESSIQSNRFDSSISILWYLDMVSACLMISFNAILEFVDLKSSVAEFRSFVWFKISSVTVCLLVDVNFEMASVTLQDVPLYS